MLYEKPKGMKYTDMCKFIDENVYREDIDEDTESEIYKYLYLIANMLAHKGRFFKKREYYDDFSVYMATSTFMRLKNPKQFEITDNGTPRQEKVKSVLNYMKKTIYPRKVNFEQEFYSQTVTPSVEGVDNCTYYTLSQKMADSIDIMSMSNFKDCLGDVVLTARAYLKKIPYYTGDRETWLNIYLSCLLSFLNSVTLPNRELNRLKNTNMSTDSQERMISDFYRNEGKDCTILYHLDDSMKDYITVLTRELKHAIAKDLSYTSHRYISSEYDINSLVLAEVNGSYQGYNSYEE